MHRAEGSEQVAACLLPVLRETFHEELDIAHVQLSYVLNRGGFVNASFTVSDGRRRLHVKVARDADTVACLRRWQAVASHLSRHYFAPAVVRVLPLSPSMEATVFEHVDGVVASWSDPSWVPPSR